MLVGSLVACGDSGGDSSATTSAAPAAASDLPANCIDPAETLTIFPPVEGTAYLHYNENLGQADGTPEPATEFICAYKTVPPGETSTYREALWHYLALEYPDVETAGAAYRAEYDTYGYDDPSTVNGVLGDESGQRAVCACLIVRFGTTILEIKAVPGEQWEEPFVAYEVRDAAVLEFARRAAEHLSLTAG